MIDNSVCERAIPMFCAGCNKSSVINTGDTSGIYETVGIEIGVTYYLRNLMSWPDKLPQGEG